MKLVQRRAYRSITNFPSAELPPFTLLTGTNGSGKSHLLEALANGSIVSDIAPNFRTDVALLSYLNLVPNDVGITSVTQIYQHRDWFVQTTNSHKDQRNNELFDLLGTFGLDARFSNRPWDALNLSIEEISSEAKSEMPAQNIYDNIQSFEVNLENTIRNGFGQDYIKQRIFDKLKLNGRRISQITDRYFDDIDFQSSSPNLFQHTFGELFLAYFEKKKANSLRELSRSKGEIPSKPVLTDEAFEASYGRPPWDFVNDMMKRAKLDFHIDHPADYEATAYIPVLTKISTGDVVQFGALSSGEKILMSFAFSLYNSSDNRQEITRPKLILLDEVDAPLHPSMSKTLIEIINEVLVGREGIEVIMVTHSPSTVAVSPEKSIFLIDGKTKKITNESKTRAVATLTADVPTLSIDFSGRRQVFVESDYDAERYGLLYQILSPFINSDRSLSFTE